MTVPLIEASGVSKKFCRSLKRSLWYGMRDLAAEVVGGDAHHSALRTGEFWAIRGLSFELHPGETLGLIGPNGAGKTTLLRILSGLIKPDEGRVTVRGRLQALIALGAGFNPVLTGRENVYVNASILGIPKPEVDRNFASIVEFAGIGEFIDSPVRSYSSGMAVRLGFAVAAHLRPNVLLVDEVLAVGDEGFQVKCTNRIGDLRKAGSVIVLVSHNMHIISNYSDRVLLQTTAGVQMFEDVAAGVAAYRRIFGSTTLHAIEKHLSTTNDVDFYDATIRPQDILPGDDLRIRFMYRANTALPNIEIDTTLYLGGSPLQHHQATNRTFSRPLSLAQGSGWVEVCLHNLRPVNTRAVLGVAIWKDRRTEQLLWWRIPLNFIGTPLSAGTCLYEMTFATSQPD